jgi:hypothetical protein
MSKTTQIRLDNYVYITQNSEYIIMKNINGQWNQNINLVNCLCMVTVLLIILLLFSNIDSHAITVNIQLKVYQHYLCLA